MLMHRISKYSRCYTNTTVLSTVATQLRLNYTVYQITNPMAMRSAASEARLRDNVR